MTITSEHKYITRFEYNRSKGWWFRFGLKGNWNIPENDFFSDLKYETKESALKAALKHRNKFLKKNKLLQLLSGRKKDIFRNEYPNNKSGIVGVQKSFRTIDKNIFYEWVCSGSIDGKRWRKSFGIKKLGDKQAFLNACDERYKRHGALKIKCSISQLPYKLKVPYELLINQETH